MHTDSRPAFSPVQGPRDELRSALWRIAFSCAAAIFMVSPSLAKPGVQAGQTSGYATQSVNYLSGVVDEEKLAAAFNVPIGGVITRPTVTAFLVSAGVEAFDAALISDWKYSVDSVHANQLNQEFRAYSEEYFGTPGLTNLQINTIITNQGGYTTKQHLAYLRVGFGGGRCTNQRVGTGTCQASVLDFQTHLQKVSDQIFNLRYRSTVDLKWENPFALNREDIAYRLIFDAVARQFGGYAYNPLRDIVLNTTDPSSGACDLLTSTFQNGASFESTLNRIRGMPPSLARASGNFIKGVTEESLNTKTGNPGMYRYGLFNFIRGNNCSRLEADERCYVGEPALAEYLLIEKSVQSPLEDDQFRWTCTEIATMIDVLVSNPYENPYDILATPTTYLFNPETYPLRGAPVNLTAEDVLMFFIAISNGHANILNGRFIDNTPQADIKAMRVERVLNPEYVFQNLTIPVVFGQFLK